MRPDRARAGDNVPLAPGWSEDAPEFLEATLEIPRRHPARFGRVCENGRLLEIAHAQAEPAGRLRKRLMIDHAVRAIRDRSVRVDFGDGLWKACQWRKSDGDAATRCRPEFGNQCREDRHGVVARGRAYTANELVGFPRREAERLAMIGSSRKGLVEQLDATPIDEPLVGADGGDGHQIRPRVMIFDTDRVLAHAIRTRVRKR